VKTHESIETPTSLQSDRFLTGYLQLLDALFSKFPDLAKQEFGNYLFSNCLFNIDNGGVKCKGVDSRNSAYQALISLMKADFSDSIYNDLAALVKRVPLTVAYMHKPMKDIKSYSGFVGIKNLACICYMNAMLQQFYTTEAFRCAVFMLDDNKQPNLKTVKDRQGKEIVVDDNVVHQLQKMFAFLELSDQPDYNPFEFCYSFKDYDG
jgi:ubiquitin carboxyl-terminal hydrolase 34